MTSCGYENPSMVVSRVFHWAEFRRGRRENLIYIQRRKTQKL